MAKYDDLKTAIKQAIKQNGNQEITGNLLQSTLLSMVDSLGENKEFLGFASPTTDPGTPKGEVFYFASGANLYENFPINAENKFVSTSAGLNIIYNKANGYWDWASLIEISQKLGNAEDKVVSQKTINDNNMLNLAKIAAPYIVQPETGADNLFLRTPPTAISICLNNEQYNDSVKYKTDGTVIATDVITDVTSKWSLSQLVKVEPNTIYSVVRVNKIFEFDEDFRLINLTEKSGYANFTITTSANTKYVAINLYKTDLTDVKVIQKGETVTATKNFTAADLPEVDKLNLINRTFKTKAITSDKIYNRILVIGDSITAAQKWQKKVGEITGADIRTHAKGGIGIIAMVDGDGSGSAPEGYDPDNFGVSTIYALNSKDVSGVDLIILMGFYNERNTANNTPGQENDMYPNQTTFTARLNYAIKRVYEELIKANNISAKIVLCSAHKYGKYQYIDRDSYEDGEKLYEVTKKVADYNSLPLIDLMHNSMINKYNWNYFQNANTPYNSLYITGDGTENNGINKPFSSLDLAPDASSHNGYLITVGDTSNYKAYKSDGKSWNLYNASAPWNSDQLHLNTNGYYKIGEYIAGFIKTLK